MKQQIEKIEEDGQTYLKVPYVYTDDFGNEGVFYRKEVIRKEIIENEIVLVQKKLDELYEKNALLES